MIHLKSERMMAVAISPLPNLLAKAASGAELVHNLHFTALDEGGFSGEARIRLAADRSSLAVTIPSAAIHPDQLRLVRVTDDAASASPLECGDEADSCELLMLVLKRPTEVSAGGGGFTKKFEASEHIECLDIRMFRTRGLSFSAVRRDSVAGITLLHAPMRGSPSMTPTRAPFSPVPGIEENAGAHLGSARPCRSQTAASDNKMYLQGRMLNEIGAALSSKGALAAGVHIRLATLYAQQIASGPATPELKIA